MNPMTRFILAAALCTGLMGIAPAQNRPLAERITHGPVLEGTGSSWAVVAWTTDTGGSTVVHYGADPNNLTQTAEAPYSDNEATRSQNHRVRISNLQPGTTYYYRVDSGQGEGTGTNAMSAVQQFTTKGNGGSSNAQPQRITRGPAVESTGPDSAQITWTTDVGGSSIVHYGVDPNNLAQTAQARYSHIGANTNNDADHRVTIDHLQPNTTYYYRVQSGQSEGTGTEAMSPVQQFTTSGSNSARLGEAQRITHGPVVEGTGADWAVIAWTTDAGGSSTVRYGTDRNNLAQIAQSGYSHTASTGGANHRVRVEHLQPNTTYYFIVDSGQGQGTGTAATSNVESFHTKS